MLVRKNLLFTILVCIAVATAYVPSVCAQDASKKTLRVNGAGMAASQVQKWAGSFMQANPDTNILVVGSSAGAGFQALFEESADLAMASRPISEEEQKKAAAKGIKLADKLIGHAGVSLITHPKILLTNLHRSNSRRYLVANILIGSKWAARMLLSERSLVESPSPEGPCSSGICARQTALRTKHGDDGKLVHDSKGVRGGRLAHWDNPCKWGR